MSGGMERMGRIERDKQKKELNKKKLALLEEKNNIYTKIGLLEENKSEFLRRLTEITEELK